MDKLTATPSVRIGVLSRCESRLLFSLLFAACLSGCAATPPRDSQRHGLDVDVTIGAGIAPVRAPRAIPPLRTHTATPLSLWLFAAAAEPRRPRAGIAIELDVLDGAGVVTSDAVVQPTRLRTDEHGYAAPLTFLATRAGEYVVRATFRDGDHVACAYSARVVVDSTSTR